MSKWNPKQKEFYDLVKKILWQKWDPIGVYESDVEWDDEYDSYAPHIFRLAVEGKDEVRIANSLSSSAEQNMGLNPAREHDLNIAKLILKTKNEILG